MKKLNVQLSQVTREQLDFLKKHVGEASGKDPASYSDTMVIEAAVGMMAMHLMESLVVREIAALGGSASESGDLEA